MKPFYLSLATASLLVIFAACHSWAGDTVRAVEPPKAKAAVDGGDAIAFVTGDEAEPPEMPDGIPMPEPRKASGIKPAAAKNVAAQAKEAKYATPETVKKKPPIRHVSAKAVPAAPPTQAAKPVHAKAEVRWND